MKYMLIAGEASGDLHASHLIESIRKFDENAEFRFFGGDLMAKAARRKPDLHYDKMNVMGFSEVLRKLPNIFRNLRAAKRLLADYRPDSLILIDYPGFNLKLAKYAHKLGVRVDYFISPKVWAWKEWRVKKIKRYVDSMLSILPFEVSFYQRHDYKVTYVGNPSVQEIDYALGHLPPLRHFIERQGLGDDPRPIIALLPGSRKGEIRNNLHLMIEAVKKFPDFRYVVAAAPSVPERFYREVAQDPGLPVVFGCTPTLLKYSRAAVVTSGTATLETALIGTPQVVCYRANGKKISYKIMEKLLKVKYVSLPNLIIGNQAVPELLVHHCTVEGIARELSPLLQNSPQREWQINSYKTMRRKLGTSIAADYAAEIIVDAAKENSTMEKEAASTADNSTAQIKSRPKKARKMQSRKSESDGAPASDAEKQPAAEAERPRRRKKPRRNPAAAGSEDVPAKQQGKPVAASKSPDDKTIDEKEKSAQEASKPRKRRPARRASDSEKKATEAAKSEQPESKPAEGRKNDNRERKEKKPAEMNQPADEKVAGATAKPEAKSQSRRRRRRKPAEAAPAES